MNRAVLSVVQTFACVSFIGHGALAGDGVIEINHPKALAGGATVGDGAGYPVSIHAAGSYRLTGNLTLPDENSDGIQIMAEGVTLDLNGFSIVGPTSCGGEPLACAPQGSGRGISISAGYVVIRNGMVRGAGGAGIEADSKADFVRVENVQVAENGSDGIYLSGDSYVVDCQAFFNGSSGISVITGLVRGSMANKNLGWGIAAKQIIDSQANFNADRGIYGVGYVLVRGSMTNGNTDDGIEIDGYAHLRDCVSGGNDGAGAEIEGGTVHDCMMDGNDGGGLVITGTAGASYAGNHIDDFEDDDPTVVGTATPIGTNFCHTDTTCP
jgi:hypothetical protein